MDMIVTVPEAKTNYSKLLKRVMGGERIIIDTNFSKSATAYVIKTQFIHV